MQNSTQLTLTNTSETSVDVSWNNGDGSARILIVKKESPANKFPLDGTDYSASSTFSAGDDLGDGNYVVYSGSGSSVSVTGLSANTNYHFRLFEYNQSSISGNNSLYLLANSKMDSINTSATSVNDETIPLEFTLGQNYPNPFNPSMKISWQSPVGGHQSLKVYDILGNEIAPLVDEYRPAGNYEIEFKADNLTSGIYFYQLKTNSFVETRKMILIK